MLVYHRIGGGTSDERDLAADDFVRQMDLLVDHDIVSLDTALDGLDGGVRTHQVVLTFDDGFADVYRDAWPVLAARRLPFTVYLATAYVGGQMQWEGSTASAPGPALTWTQLEELVASGLCTVGNHTHSHVRPERLTTDELDRCTDEIERRLGVTPRHFAFPWGIPVSGMEAPLRMRFRSAATGKAGRNLPGDDPMQLRRVPVRKTDPLTFFAAKLTGGLAAERTYAGIVSAAKLLGVPA